MSSSSGAAPGANNENPETTVSDNNEVTPFSGGNEADQNLAQSDNELSQDFLDAGEVLPLSKSQDLSEDDTPIPKIELFLEREVVPELATVLSHNSITYPEVQSPVCQIIVAPLTPTLQFSTHLLGEDNSDGDNDSYMRSITSLVGGGEGPIRSLSNILVWTETAMGTATGFLDASHTSVTDVLHGSGTVLRSMTSLLGEASEVLTSSLLSGTSTVLQTVSQVLGSIERRTVEGIRFALHFVACRISPHRNNSNYDNN